MVMTGVDVDINDAKEAEKIASEMLDLPEQISRSRRNRQDKYTRYTL